VSQSATDSIYRALLVTHEEWGESFDLENAREARGNREKEREKDREREIETGTECGFCGFIWV